MPRALAPESLETEPSAVLLIPLAVRLGSRARRITHGTIPDAGLVVALASGAGLLGRVAHGTVPHAGLLVPFAAGAGLGGGVADRMAIRHAEGGIDHAHWLADSAGRSER